MSVTAVPDAPATTRPESAAGVSRWLLAAVVLVVAALALRALALFDHDDPPRVQLAHDAEIVLPLVTGATSVIDTVWHDPRAGERLWKYALVAANGQLDHRLSSLATLGLQIGAFAVLLAALAAALGRRVAFGVGLAVALVGIAPTLAAVRPPLGSATTAGTVLLSLATLLLVGRAGTTRALSWGAIAFAVLNLLWSNAGIAAIVALAVWSLVTQRRALQAAAAALIVVGAALGVARGGLMPSAAAHIMSWPFNHVALALMGWAPVVLYLARWVGRDRPGGVLPLLALWALLQPVALAASGIAVADAGEYLLAAIGINVAALVALRPPGAGNSPRYLLLAGAWLVLVVDAIVHRPPPIADEQHAAAVLSRRDVAGILPIALRPPLSLRPEGAPGPFQPGAAPDRPGLGGLPVVGTWMAAGGNTVGEFISAPLTSPFPLVQLRVAGVMRPPATTLVLRTAAGAEVLPLDSGFKASDRWKRVNFATPQGAFRIVARDNSPTEWLAISAPIEVGQGTRLAGKLPNLWPFLGAVGLVAAAAGLVRGRRRRPQPDLRSGHDFSAVGRVIPWLGVFAYALFFSHHVDPTAGPNDSGGYLNSAQLLAHGTVAASPRIPAGVEIDRDPLLYTPITFHVKGERLVPEYPVGFPLEVSALAQMLPFGRAVYVVILLQLVLGVIFTERLARAFGLERGWAWFAAAIVGLSPVYLFQALQPQSDGPALVWVTAAVYWAWTSREHPARAIAAGLAAAFAVMLRPSNVLCLFPVAACVVGPHFVRRSAYLAIAGLPGAIWLMWYQHTLYGSWHTTGYGDVSTSFGWHFFPPTVQSYVKWLPEMFTPLVVLAVLAPFQRTISAHARIVLALWVALFVAFYSVYWCTWDNWYNMRFVMPAAPAMVIMGLLVARAAVGRLADRGPTFARWLRSPIAAAVAVTLVLGFLTARIAARDVLYWLHNNHEHEFAARWVGEHVPRNAVVFAKHATGSLMHYTSLPFIRTDHPKATDSTALYDTLERAGFPIYALTYHWETKGYTWQGPRGSGYPDLPGQWDRVAIMWDNDVMVWKRRPTAVPVAEK